MDKGWDILVKVTGGEIPWMSASDLAAHLMYFYELRGQLNDAKQVYVLKPLLHKAETERRNTVAWNIIERIRDKHENSVFKGLLTERSPSPPPPPPLLGPPRPPTPLSGHHDPHMPEPPRPPMPEIPPPTQPV